MVEHFDILCDCPGRYCRGCEQTKCHSAFSKDAKGSLGLSSRCKDCVRAYQKSHIDEINARRREYKKEQADHFREYEREYHRKNPESKKARNRRYREENREKISAQSREYQKNSERYKARHSEYNRRFRQGHPELNSVYFANRQSRERNADGSFTPKEWRAVCMQYNYTCLCCGKREPEIKLTADHVIPLA